MEPSASNQAIFKSNQHHGLNQKNFHQLVCTSLGCISIEVQKIKNLQKSQKDGELIPLLLDSNTEHTIQR